MDNNNKRRSTRRKNNNSKDAENESENNNENETKGTKHKKPSKKPPPTKRQLKQQLPPPIIELDETNSVQQPLLKTYQSISKKVEEIPKHAPSIANKPSELDLDELFLRDEKEEEERYKELIKKREPPSPKKLVAKEVDEEVVDILDKVVSDVSFEGVLDVLNEDRDGEGEDEDDKEPKKKKKKKGETVKSKGGSNGSQDGKNSKKTKTKESDNMAPKPKKENGNKKSPSPKKGTQLAGNKRRKKNVPDSTELRKFVSETNQFYKDLDDFQLDMGDEGEDAQTKAILFVERADDSIIFDELDDDKKVSVKKILVFNSFDKRRQETFELELNEELAYITSKGGKVSPQTKLKREYEEYKKTITDEIMEEPMSFEDYCSLMSV